MLGRRAGSALLTWLLKPLSSVSDGVATDVRRRHGKKSQGEMMHVRKRLLAAGSSLFLGMATLTVFASSSAADQEVADSRSAPSAILEDAVPGVVSPEEAESAIYVDENGHLIELDANGDPTFESGDSTSPEPEISPMAGCTPATGVDRPHISTWSTGPAVQAHGWWDRGSCSGDTATVTVCLYEYYTNHAGEGYFERKDCDTKSVRPGGGSSARATAHEDCDDRVRVTWRAHADVDVNWEVDTAETAMKQYDVDCRVF